ncbi:MAG: NgoMIV family type II restriction endonuclease, partial [Atopobiaceae bacterium]|nr:NgoMIV family type II restriction endonuclease [Atopobiaceae bacterium]
MTTSTIGLERELFHKRLCESGLLVFDHGIASNADSSSVSSKAIGEKLAGLLGAPTGRKLAGQTSGAVFEREIASFVSRTFRELQQAVRAYSEERGVDDSLEALDGLVMGRRLKDISD